HLNQPPVNSVPGPQAVVKGTMLTFDAANNNQIVISDPDAIGATDQENVGVTAQNGSLAAADNSGAVVTGTPDGTGLTILGTLSQINAALNGLVFTPDNNYSGAARITIDTNDGGHDGYTYSGGQYIAAQELTTDTTIPITVDANSPFVTFASAPTTLYITGSGGNDNFSVSFSNSTTFLVTFNGLTQMDSTVANSSGLNVYTSVNYVSHGGLATATISGNGQPVTANLYAGSFQYSGTGYLVTGTGIGTGLFVGNSTDTANETGSSNAVNTLTATPTMAKLSGSGYQNTATGFGHVVANSNYSGDVANLSDTGGTNTFTTTTSSATASSATFAGSGFNITTNYFHKVTATAGGGGNDSAGLYGLSGASNVFTATPTTASMQGSGYTYTVNGFKQVQAYSGATATLSTTGGTNTLTAFPSYTTLSGANYSITAHNFGQVNAQSAASANDTATLNDPSGKGNFTAYSTYAYLTASGNTNQVTGFKNVIVVGVSGGTGTANLYDSTSGSDTLTFNNTVGGVQSSLATLVGAGFNYSINFGFKTFNVNGSTTGNDVANVFDSSGNDVLFAAGDQFQLTYPSLALNLTNYKTVNAKSINGGSDSATVRSIDYALNATGNWVNK
ncbi:MAG TPA: hypothetical protein VIK18_01605, partial [Pirellulales bacterium]